MYCARQLSQTKRIGPITFRNDAENREGKIVEVAFGGVKKPSKKAGRRLDGRRESSVPPGWHSDNHQRSRGDPARRSLTSHRRRCTSVSYAWRFERIGRRFERYWPWCAEASGSEASQTMVSAPCSGVSENGIASFAIAPRKPPPSWPKLDATRPGCTARGVTPVPGGGRASWKVRGGWHSWGVRYARQPM